jgi:predicted nucleic acid-binding protein
VIFVDTSFWVAWRNRRDPFHERTAKLLEQSGSTAFLTTNHVRGEAWTLMRRRMGHRLAVAFLDALERSPRTRLVRISDDQEEEALAWLRRHDERPYSFVDATSFVVMRSLHVEQALTFDTDFAAAGFRALGVESR